MKKKQIIILDLCLLVLVAVSWPLSSLMLRYFPACPFPAMGFLCPACGSTRCVRFLLQGQLGEAFISNPFTLVLIGYVAVSLGILNVGVLLQRPQAERIARRLLSWRFVLIASILFGVFGIVRNFW